MLNKYLASLYLFVRNENHESQEIIGATIIKPSSLDYFLHLIR